MAMVYNVVLNKIDLAKELELEIYRIDSRVKKVNYSLYGEGNGKTILKNTKGIFQIFFVIQKCFV